MNILSHVLYMDCRTLIANVNWCWTVEWSGINILCEDCEIAEYFNYGTWHPFLWWNPTTTTWRTGDSWHLSLIDIMRNYMAFSSHDKSTHRYPVAHFRLTRYLTSQSLAFRICKVWEHLVLPFHTQFQMKVFYKIYKLLISTSQN